MVAPSSAIGRNEMLPAKPKPAFCHTTYASVPDTAI